MRKYLISLSSLILFFSCIGGKSVPVQFYTLNIKGESPTPVSIVEVRASAKVHQRFNLENGEKLELREFERWQDSPNRLVETEMKNYFSLGKDELRCELNEFVFDVENMQAKISIDFVLRSGAGDQQFRVKSAQSFTELDGASLVKAMSSAVHDVFKQLDQKIIEGK
ncbi:hypothetical protein PQO01_18580 [Lentisphaera marina]|uniref:hypothetical protein n=1 Tax=Lentisphaera marina TaxID=1111041 RepID=UPI002365B227|nr:hypothetical protein [Lentisphaera marina]MDD7986959.1 hypothetical protein [Lentisphaera marina]